MALPSEIDDTAPDHESMMHSPLYNMSVFIKWYSYKMYETQPSRAPKQTCSTFGQSVQSSIRLLC